MKWFILLVGVVVVCFVVALVLGLLGGGMGRATSTMSHEPLPDEDLTDADLDDLVFDVTARGYRMGEVDAVVDRLRRALREKDEQIAVLRGDRERDAAPAPEPEKVETGRTVDEAAAVDEPETVDEPAPARDATP